MYRIMKRFRDKYTKEIYNPGDLVDFTKDRAKEITDKLGGSYIKAVKKIAGGEKVLKGGRATDEEGADGGRPDAEGRAVE